MTGFSSKLHFVSSLVSWITLFARFYTLAVPFYLEILKSSDVLKNRMILRTLEMAKFNALFSYFSVEIAKTQPRETLSRQNGKIRTNKVTLVTRRVAKNLGSSFATFVFAKREIFCHFLQFTETAQLTQLLPQGLPVAVPFSGDSLHS